MLVLAFLFCSSYRFHIEDSGLSGSDLIPSTTMHLPSQLGRLVQPLFPGRLNRPGTPPDAGLLVTLHVGYTYLELFPSCTFCTIVSFCVYSCGRIDRRKRIFGHVPTGCIFYLLQQFWHPLRKPRPHTYLPQFHGQERRLTHAPWSGRFSRALHAVGPGGSFMVCVHAHSCLSTDLMHWDIHTHTQESSRLPRALPPTTPATATTTMTLPLPLPYTCHSTTFYPSSSFYAYLIPLLAYATPPYALPYAAHLPACYLYGGCRHRNPNIGNALLPPWTALCGPCATHIHASYHKTHT